MHHQEWNLPLNLTQRGETPDPNIVRIDWLIVFLWCMAVFSWWGDLSDCFKRWGFEDMNGNNHGQVHRSFVSPMPSFAIIFGVTLVDATVAVRD